MAAALKSLRSATTNGQDEWSLPPLSMNMQAVATEDLHQSNTTGNKRKDQKMQKKSTSRSRVRGNSLKKAKELAQGRLQSDSTKADHPDSNMTRDGKSSKFTVSNVGNNGRMYLRPVQKPQQPPPNPTPEAPALPASVKMRPFAQIVRNASHESRDSIWTLLSHPMRFDQQSDMKARESLEMRPRHLRSHSQSTVDTQLAQERLESGAFKIVIDRPDSAPRPDEDHEGEMPALQVPIPHYRLGTPRFSARGTAFFHQSVYTKSSVTGGEDSSMFSGAELGEIFPKPPGIEAHHIISRRHSYTSPQPWLGAYGNERESGATTPQASNIYKTRGPITAELFDEIAAAPNDPSIVKYSPINRDIIAATPARIITQITSEKFLDYELLSDFFLTVRSYLSTHDLLAYLLSRFEWALSRSDDNGRVVRVRTFAALRHWILNYFSYDFVTDRELRVHFCDRLNDLARIISETPGFATTDMKLISDLKKCWNGRCLVYWDNSNASMDGLQQLEIEPGGILGSRDSRLVHASQLRPPPTAPASFTVNPAQLAAGAQSISNWYSAVMEHSDRQPRGHNRHASAGTARSFPITEQSVQSIPAVSCSIPTRHINKAMPYLSRTLAAQPVQAAVTHEVTAGPAHRRSGSFSDAARDLRAPLSTDIASSSEAIAQEIYHGNSMLRGFAFPPISAEVTPVPTTPSTELPKLQHTTTSSASASDVSNRRANTAAGPHVKGFIGNIRRALSSKHGPAGQQAGTVTGPSIAIGKSATLPQNVLAQAAKQGPLLNRVDYLAANVFDAFQVATTAPSEFQPEPDYGHMSDFDYLHNAPEFEPTEHMSDGSKRLLLPELKKPQLSRLTSGVTDSSRSILIGDETGLNIQDLDIPAVPSIPDTAHTPSMTKSIPITIDPNDQASGSHFRLAAPPILRSTSHEGRIISGQQDEAGSDWKPSIGPLRPLHNRNLSRATVRSSLRRHASFHSTLAKHNQGLSIDTTSQSRQGSVLLKEEPARLLRRRPGGDLRANENVHDMEYPTRPRSAGSIVTYSESVRESQFLGFGDKITRTFKRSNSNGIGDIDQFLAQNGNENRDAKTDVSYVRTHSSQHAIRRPSFEAAVAEFARIPDDDEGGIEATLLKLEGRYRSPVQSPVNNEFSDSQLRLPKSDQSSSHKAPVRDAKVSSDSSLRSAYDDPPSALPQVPMDRKPWLPTPLSPVHLKKYEPREPVISTLYTESEGSYNSTPLLERSDDEAHHNKGKSRVPNPKDLAARRLRQGSTAPTATTDSFLLDEGDEFLSDVSSELSMDTIDGEEKSEEWVRSMRNADEEMMMVDQQHPPSPPMTAEIAYSMGLLPNKTSLLPKPATPDLSHHMRHQQPNTNYSANTYTPATWTQTPHMSFVLGFDSQVLAQQFTILEKEALREIDWRDLVDLRWQNSLASPLNWVNYLLTQDPLGIDLVTARFNIMVKWAISEIVLTESIEERALTIMKYIHIAHQARKIHNFATLFQLTIALTSADCTRLSKTWDLVPDAEKDILQDLEILVSPRRNFHNLRAEMEKVSSDEGCIPVLALYIHDLTYNAGKPSQLPATNNGEPLINFERYRTAATIVKALLQLIDAASKYDFQPMHGAIERCLWLACLPDEMIMQKSKQLATMI